MKVMWKYAIRAGKVALLLAGCFLLLSFLEKSLFAPGLFWDSEYNGDNASPWHLAFTRENIRVEMKVGNNNKIRYGRYARLKADIDNWGSKFSGALQISLSVNGKKKIYQSGIEVPEEQKAEASIYFPAKMDDNQITISLVSGEEVLYSKEILLNVDYGSGESYIGICSDYQGLMGYLEENHQEAVYLSARSLPEDFRGLDMLDVLVISDVDMNVAKKSQIQAVTDWVKRGGTLVLADSGEGKELDAFEGKLFECVREESYQIRTSLGLTKADMSTVRQRLLEELKEQKAEQVKFFLRDRLSETLYQKWHDEIEQLELDSSCLQNGGEIYTYLTRRYSPAALADFLSLDPTEAERRAVTENIEIPKVAKRLSCLHMSNSQILIQTEKEQPILQKKQIGLGNLLLSGISLSLKRSFWDVLGMEMNRHLQENVSSQKKRQLSGEGDAHFDEAEDIYRQGLRIAEGKSLPNLKFYAALLVVYIFLIGPAVWVVMRRRKRWYLLWVIVPAAAVVFSLLIYLTGTSTRVTSPYINYLSQIQINGTGQGNMQTWFRIVYGKTGGYDTLFQGVDALSSFDAGVKYHKRDALAKEEDYAKARYLICQDEEGSRVQVQEQPPFAGIDMKLEKTVELNGYITLDIASNEMQLRGNVTNHLGITLRDCILYHNGTVYSIGTLKPGRTAMLSLLLGSEIYTQAEYAYDYNELLRQIYGSDIWTAKGSGDSEKQRHAALVAAYLGNSEMPQTFFYGFLDEEEQSRGLYDAENGKTEAVYAGLEKIPYEQHGSTGVVVELEVRGNSAGAQQ